MPPPSSPPAIGSNYTPGTPTAPPAIGGGYTPGSPTAPRAIQGNHTPGTPTAPPPVRTSWARTIRVTGTLTTDGVTPLVFPDLLPAGEREGLPCWTDTGEHPDTGSGNDYELSKQFGSWLLRKINGGTVFGFSDNNEYTDPLAVPVWIPIEFTETGTPVLSYIPPAAPPAIRSGYTPGTPSAPPAIS